MSDQVPFMAGRFERTQGSGAGGAATSMWLLPWREWEVQSTLSPAGVASALNTLDTGAGYVGREVPGLGNLRIRGEVRVSGFRIGVFPRWQHPYVPWFFGEVSSGAQGCRLNLRVRPSLVRLVYLACGLVAMGFFAPVQSLVVFVVLSHFGSLLLGFRPAVDTVESRLRELIPGHWERRI